MGTVIKINAITVPPGAGDELAHRFAARAGAACCTEFGAQPSLPSREQVEKLIQQRR